MTGVEWGDYTVRPDRSSREYQDASKRQALAWHEELMASKHSRKDGLFRLVERNGVRLSRRRDRDGDVHRVGDWFYDHVEGRPGSLTYGEAAVESPKITGIDLPVKPGENPDAPLFMADEWDSVSMDALLWLGDLVVGRNSFFLWGVSRTPKSSFNYNRSVVLLPERAPSKRMLNEYDYHAGIRGGMLVNFIGPGRDDGSRWVEMITETLYSVRYLDMTKEQRIADGLARFEVRPE